MRNRLAPVLVASLVLASCQSANTSKMQWVQFQPGDVFEIADARCRMMAQTQAQGLYAQGSASFVIGAQLGNALGNAIRMQQFYNQCMTISGWKQMPIGKPKPMVATVGFPPPPN